MATAKNSVPLFNVKWVNRSETFANGIAQLYANGKQIDFTITAGGKQLFAHRSVLSIVSPTIKLLLENMPKKPRAESK